ncbi:unnamed protein product [Diamesa serratosioi]
MKFLFALLLVVLAFTCIAGQDASPVMVTGNNVGDIITVGISANAVLSSNANLNMINAILGLINQQAIVVAGDIPAPAELPKVE